MAPNKWSDDGFVIMDKYIQELLNSESNSIIEVMAFMSYNPSIGRVFETGGVKVFKKMTLK